MKNRIPTLLQALQDIGMYSALIMEETNADELNQACEVFNKKTGQKYTVKIAVKPIDHSDSKEKERGI